jgi:hypothetical protein
LQKDVVKDMCVYMDMLLLATVVIQAGEERRRQHYARADGHSLFSPLSRKRKNRDISRRRGSKKGTSSIRQSKSSSELKPATVTARQAQLSQLLVPYQRTQLCSSNQSQRQMQI